MRHLMMFASSVLPAISPIFSQFKRTLPPAFKVNLRIVNSSRPLAFAPFEITMNALKLFSLTVCLLFIGVAHAEETAKHPGLVQAKPASGPFVKTEKGYMVPYTAKLPGTEIEYTMTPIPGGEFKMGGPENEEGHKKSEGPQFTVKVDPFWMGSHEVSWAEYKHYMSLHDIFKKFETKGIRKVAEGKAADAITAPSNLYDPTFTFQFGEEPERPALSMSQYAAKQYTKWLTKTSKRFYRLPTEAEWEYAARAGTTTRWFFGDDEGKLGDYAWYSENSDDSTQFIGKKKPNPWGLYDIYGNVAEWTLDEYTEDGYKRFKGETKTAAEAYIKPTKLYPRVVRGGLYDSDAEETRSAYRHPSHDDEWREEDPNIPLSPWWFTSYDGIGVGMRIIEPLNPPKDEAAQEAFWKADLEMVAEDVSYRIEQEGRGAFGIADPELPAAIKKMKESD